MVIRLRLRLRRDRFHLPQSASARHAGAKTRSCLAVTITSSTAPHPVKTTRAVVQDAIGAGAGVLRLEPCWVPRTFMIPGRRLRLHPDDLYALGGHRGGINERWFSSTTSADNGPGTPTDEGLSYVRLDGGQRFLLKEAVQSAGDLL